MSDYKLYDASDRLRLRNQWGSMVGPEVSEWVIFYKEKGISNREISRRLGISYNTVVRILRRESA